MTADEPASSAEPLPCAPCRGTGRLSARRGEAQETVDCPWCGGSGAYTPGHDAQAARPPAGPASTAD